MKKLLIMNDLLYGGGVEKVMMDLVNNLSSEKYEITILTPFRDKESYKFYKKDIKFITLYKGVLKQTNIFARIYNKIIKKITSILCKRYINKKHFDIAIAIKEGDTMKYISNLNVSNKIAWIHTDYDIFHWTKSSFKNDEEELECMKKFNSIVCVTKAIKDITIKKLGNSNNLCVKYNPINDKEIIKKSKELVEDIEKPKEKPLFITVGRLAKQKGYDRLLSVCKNLNKNYDYELWIIGTGQEEENLKKFIKENNLNNVKLLGLKENPYKYIAKADWFVCSSTWESFGIAIQEAIILDVPVITTYCPGACELLDTNYHGLIVENSEIGILNGMRKALIEPNLSNYYKNMILKTENKLKLNNIIKEIEKLF